MPSYNVLVVDDEIEIQEAIEIYLRNENMNVFKAGTGLEALELLEREDIHLMILDIMMPGLDGIKTTFRVRENDNHIPILMLSAKTEDTDKILGLNVGADDYMAKPFNPLELTARVKSLLRRYTRFGRYGKSQASKRTIRLPFMSDASARKSKSIRRNLIT